MRNHLTQPDAIAQIRGGHKAPALYGSVQFYQKTGYVFIVADIAGLPSNSPTGFFALHIHEGGNCEGENFPNTGSHYDLSQAQHPRHAGDLPPLMLCNSGAYMAVKTDRFHVQNIIGKTVVIHSGSDDFHTQPAGNSGEKIACGTISMVSDTK